MSKKMKKKLLVVTKPFNITCYSRMLVVTELVVSAAIILKLGLGVINKLRKREIQHTVLLFWVYFYFNNVTRWDSLCFDFSAVKQTSEVSITSTGSRSKLAIIYIKFSSKK